MIVVSDTSSISALLTVGRISLLHQLYDEILIPDAVWQELRHYHPEVCTLAFLKQCLVINRTAVDSLLETLDSGEAEAIVLALEQKAEVLLIDESMGRRIATEQGIPIMGLMGVLLLAKKRGLVPSVTPLMEDIEQKAGFYLNRSLKAQILADTGEG